MKHLLFAVTCVVLLSNFQCGEPEGDKVFNLNEPFTYQFGDFYVENNGGNLSMQFSSIVADSRCATGVICVWQGEVAVEMKYFAGNASVTDTLRLGGLNADPTMDSTIFEGYKIKLTKVDPYPELNIDIPAADYKLNLIVTKI